jgi:N-methylhydantoinase B
MLPDVVAGCLQQALSGGVPAEGASSLWNPQIFGGGSLVDEVEAGTDANTLPEFSTVIFHCGGAGARPQKDGLSATAFPSGVRTIPVEATESVAPVVFYRREFRDGSGGPGQFRGGLGQVIELGGAGANPLALLCNFERVRHPARGRSGGQPGGAGQVTLRSGRPIRPKGRQTVPPRDAICLQLPGGGGFGDPRSRDLQRVRDDVLDGLITAEQARRDYGVAIDASGEINLPETKRLRAKGRAG